MGIDSRISGTEGITTAFGRTGSTSGWMRWRAALGGPAVAVASLIAALVATRSAGLPLRDPDGVASGRLGIAALLVCGLVLIDILVRASRRSEGWRPTRETLLAVRRERWTVARVLPVSIALLSFFASYFAYRNLKSVVPLLRPEIYVVVLTTTINALKTFGPIYAMTRGGPGNATMVASYFSYKNFFQNANVGYGATMATVLTLIVMAIAVVYIRVQTRQEENG